MASVPVWLQICYEVASELFRKSSLCSYMKQCEVYARHRICSGKQVYVYIWLQSCSRNQVCVHVWHHVRYKKCFGVVPVYMISDLVWLQICYEVIPELLQKSSLCSYMTLCGVYCKCSGVLQKTSLCSYMAPELLQKSSLYSYMASCGVWKVLLEWFQSCSGNEVYVHMAQCDVYGKCSGVAIYLLWSGSRVAPKIKFVFIYGTMWVYNKCSGVGYKKGSGNQVYVHIWHYVRYMLSALEWLQICSRKQV